MQRSVIRDILSPWPITAVAWFRAGPRFILVFGELYLQFSGRIISPCKVKDVLKMLEKDGWYLAKTRGSHCQFKHPVKPGKVTVSGKPSVNVPLGTLNSVLKQAGLK